MRLPFDPHFRTTRSFLIKILLLIQLYALLTIPELLLLFYLAQRFGKFTVIATVLATSLLGLFLATNSIASLMRRVKARFAQGHPPRRELGMLALLLISAYLLIAPGLIGFVLGIVIYYTPLKIGLRKIVYRRFESVIRVLYYYMKLSP